MLQVHRACHNIQASTKNYVFFFASYSNTKQVKFQLGTNFYFHFTKCSQNLLIQCIWNMLHPRTIHSRAVFFCLVFNFGILNKKIQCFKNLRSGLEDVIKLSGSSYPMQQHSNVQVEGFRQFEKCLKRIFEGKKNLVRK